MNFNEYLYVPTIRTRLAEMQGVAELKSNTKQKILPFVELSKAHQVKQADKVFEKWNKAFLEPAIISIANDKPIRVEEYDTLLEDSNNFKNWQVFLDQIANVNPNIIPAAQITPNCSRRAFLAQLKDLESRFGRVVLKVNPRSKRECQAAIYAASAITSIEKLLIIIENGQITPENQNKSLNSTTTLLNALRQEDQSIEIVTSASSFPKSFPPYTTNKAKSYGEIPILEWQNYHSFGGKDVAIYGDHASIHAMFYEPRRATFVARVDYPTPGTWIFERRQLENKDDPRDVKYTEASRAIIQNECWDEELEAWGKDIIIKSAEGILDKFKSQSKSG
ncbi:hypothetical protein [Pseudoalteromonas sp. S2755]|uniref:beta family protein n=1 Tax=Pseudoalteromonas sp. S2755 TaxID=2066523 RepID=UPI00110A3DBB|nr:hypothetical protein [Pseudoalteromonas sp. S2755]TMN34115.1 hypothetical protein CWC03_17135 [Pseudoalteromonas sp. S2755]